MPRSSLTPLTPLSRPSNDDTSPTKQSNPGSLYCITLSGLAEGAILIILFYWAPWLREAVHLSGGAEAKIPDVVVYSCYLVVTIIGTYLAQIYARDLGEDMLLQVVM